MKKVLNIGKASIEDILKNERKIRREIEIENNLNIAHGRVHESKKAYKRQQKHRNNATKD